METAARRLSRHTRAGLGGLLRPRRRWQSFVCPHLLDLVAMNLSLTLQAIAQRMPDRPAVSWEEGALGYGAFEDQVQRIAGALQQRHALRPGARVALAMENCAELLPALYGIWRAGLAAVPLNSKLHAREMAWILADSETRLCLASAKLAEGLSAPAVSSAALPPILAIGTADYRALLAGGAAGPPPADPQGEAWLFYTSGTTGRPKGAVLTHRNLLFSCHCYYADIDQIGPEDTILHAAPLTHGSGLYGLAHICLLYTSPSPRDISGSRMPSSA